MVSNQWQPKLIQDIHEHVVDPVIIWIIESEMKIPLITMATKLSQPYNWIMLLQIPIICIKKFEWTKIFTINVVFQAFKFCRLLCFHGNKNVGYCICTEVYNIGQ